MLLQTASQDSASHAPTCRSPALELDHDHDHDSALIHARAAHLLHAGRHVGRKCDTEGPCLAAATERLRITKGCQSHMVPVKFITLRRGMPPSPRSALLYPLHHQIQLAEPGRVLSTGNRSGAAAAGRAEGGRSRLLSLHANTPDTGRRQSPKGRRPIRMCRSTPVQPCRVHDSLSLLGGARQVV